MVPRHWGSTQWGAACSTPITTTTTNNSHT